jgi:hypothetical protein
VLMAEKIQIIVPEAYPQMLNKSDAARAMLMLRAPETRAKAEAAARSCAAPMRAAILKYVSEMEQAGDDIAQIFAKVHEIRGFADTAGLFTTGRISKILCRYIDDMERIQRPMEPNLVMLHVAAIARAARAEEGDMATGEAVAAELAALVARRLEEAAGSR